MHKVYAFYPDELISYLEKIENATPDEIKAAVSLFSEKPLPEILKINGDTAQITINGPLSMKGPSPIARFFRLGGTGYLQIIEAINKIPDSVKKVELLMNTPGGEVLGVDNVFQAVKALSEKKEVIAINQGMIASAGYWIASAAKKIISESPVNLTGSIGVVIITIDSKKWEDRIGFRVVRIVSRNAPEKAPDVSKKSGIEALQKLVDSTERIFMKRISEGRGLSIGHIQKNYGRGNVLVSLDPDGTDAIDVKMIDEVITGEKEEEENGKIYASDYEEKTGELINGIESIIELNPLAPYPNEHAARLLNPNIEKIRVRRTSGSGNGTIQGVKIPASIDIIWYIQKKGNKEIPRAQSLRFPISNWTEKKAKDWLKAVKINYILFEPAQKTKSENSNTPASAGINKQEVIMPTTLKEFLAENPAAQAEYKEALDNQYKAGVKAGNAEKQEVIEKLAPFLQSDSYDAAIRSTVLKALKGEITPDAVIAAISIDDARKENENSNHAKNETENTAETPGQQHKIGSGNGKVMSNADLDAEIARINAKKGGPNGVTK